MSIMSMLVAGGGGAFTPLSLFSGGVQGVWYDPSDLTTMFEDATGLIPVHTPGNGTADSPVGKLLDKSGNANHATQLTVTARPTLSALYNLFRYTEQLDNAYWGKTRVTTASTSATDPLGGSTAEQFLEDSSNNTHYVDKFNGYAGLSAVSYTWSFYIKSSGRQWVGCEIYDTASRMTYFDVVNGVVGTNAAGNTATITSAGNGWWRCSITRTLASAATTYFVWYFATGDGGPTSYTGDVTKGFYIWGADLRVSNDGVGLPAYQRVVDANTYDSTGFPYYLKADGVDDYLRVSSLDMTSTNKVGLFTAIRVLSDTDTQLIHDFNTAASGQFVFYYKNPTYGATLYYGGTSQVNLYSNAALSSPAGKVFTSTGDISAPLGLIRQNGTQVASTTASVGTGNFGNGILDLFARGSGAFRLNGRMYGHIFRGAASTATEISNTEAWLNGKAKIY